MLEELQNIRLESDLRSDDDLRKTINLLLNLIEDVYTQNQGLLSENKELKDEINRLKGEQGVPKFGKGKDKKESEDYSSEKNRRRKKKSKEKVGKGSRKSKIQIDKEVIIKVNKDDLPKDAKFTGYKELIQQNLKLVRENVKYRVEVYYSASEKRTIIGALPAVYEGHYGSDMKALLHSLHHVCDVTQGRLECLLHSMGMVISSGTISNLLNGELDWALKEQNTILSMGIESSAYVQTDSTSNKEKGEKRTTHIFSGDYFSVYHTLKNKSRLCVLHGLQGAKEELQLQYNERTQAFLQAYNIAKADIQSLIVNFGRGIAYGLRTFKSLVLENIPTLAAKKNMFTRVLNSFALSYYYEQTDMPVVEVLLSDDAPEYKTIPLKQHALCWIHDARYYNKLTPLVAPHRKRLKQVKEEYWDFYRLLLEFREIEAFETKKIAIKRQEIEQQFEEVFTQVTQYNQLDKLIEKTYRKKKELLAVLDVPALPLHNNAAELAARRVVRKRDISLHTWSEQGTKTRDAFMSIVETAIKLGINPIEYIAKRIRGQQLNHTLEALIKKAYEIKTTPTF